MNKILKILAISGSTKAGSTNNNIIGILQQLSPTNIRIETYPDISNLPHFNPDRDKDPLPEEVAEFRKKIEHADGVLFSTPEYVFSLPGSLKNAIEWTVSTMVFTNKPVAVITAAASGQKAHESLLLIMETLQAKIHESTSLLIPGAKGKIGKDIETTEENTGLELKRLLQSFSEMVRGQS